MVGKNLAACSDVGAVAMVRRLLQAGCIGGAWPSLQQVLWPAVGAPVGDWPKGKQRIQQQAHKALLPQRLDGVLAAAH